jgi:RNA polymerase sigma-70 factor (ECF subfamily)
MTADAERVPPSVPPTDSSRAAFDTHVVPEIEVLLRVARSLTRNDADAEDLVQDTLVRAFRGIDTFDGRHPRAWLLTILRNTHINRNRRQRPELFRDADGESRELDEIVGSESTDAGVELTFDAEIEHALAELDERFRAVVELVDIDGLSYAEAAEALGVPTGTVMSRLHRARGRIRDRLDRAGLAPRSG